jgi:uncharacterized OB-fold protein
MNPTEYDKPLPVLDDLNRPFWEATRQGVLSLQACEACGHIRYPISQVCPRCLSERFEWKPVSGRGKVLSSIVFHQVYNPAFASEVPYNVSLIQLAEGARMFSNVTGIAPSDVKVGAEVEVIFEGVTPEVTLPRFKLRTP